VSDVVGVEARSSGRRRGGTGRDSDGASSNDPAVGAPVVGGGGRGGQLRGQAEAAVDGLARERGGEASRHDHRGSSN
jgi:hypothetical protein